MFMNYNGIVEEYDIYIELKFFELKLLKKSVVKYDIRVWFDGRSRFYPSPQFIFGYEFKFYRVVWR